MKVLPTSLARIANRPLLGRNATNGKRSLAGVAIGQPQYGLLKVAHVPWIFSAKEVIAYCLVEFRGRAIGTSLPQEMLGQWNDVFVAFAQRRQPGHETGDPVIEVCAELAPTNEVPKVPIGGAKQPKFASAPRVAAYALIGALLNHAKQLRL